MRLLISTIMIMLFSSNLSFAFDHTHAKWDEILKSHTVKEHSQVFFNYAKLKAKDIEFSKYLVELESVTKKEFEGFTNDQKLAFWINVYNAYTVKLIIKNYPLKSIKDIGSFFMSAWKMEFFKIFGKKMTLDAVEHDNIRKHFKEPRIHFAVNCASIGCPSLLPEAFEFSKLESQLENAANNFVNNKNKNFYDRETKTLYLSKIFKWYGADFNAKYKGARNFVRKKLKLKKSQVKEYKFLDYNWDLNKG